MILRKRCELGLQVVMVFHLIFPSPGFAAVPPQINHQGFVRVNGVPFNGTGVFRFAIVDPDSGLNGWTNDGSALFVSGIPAMGVEAPVASGLYSVRLGDATEFNMPPIPTEIFSDDNLVLRVWFDDGVNGIRQLTPDHPLTSSPYSFQSVLSDTALNGIPSGFAILSETTEAPPGFIATTLQVTAGDSWRVRASMPTPRQILAAGVANNRIYAIGGLGGQPSESQDVNEAYDPLTNTWTPRAAMPTPRCCLGVGVIGERIYAIGGVSTSANENEEYDPVANTWESKAPMPSPRFNLAVGVVGSKIYAIGGTTGISASGANEEYDPVTDSWEPKAMMPTPRGRIGIGVVRRRFFSSGSAKESKGFLIPTFRNVISAIGGETSDPVNPGTTTPSDVHEEYDPQTNMWRTRASLPSPRTAMGVGVIDNRIYSVAGRAAPFFADNDVYDPGTDTWSPRSPIPSPRSDHVVGVVDNRLYAIGGNLNSANTGRNEEYTPPKVLFVHTKE